MKILYMILLISSLLMGAYDNGDITAFVFVLLFGSLIGAVEIAERIRETKRRYRIVIKKQI